VEKMENEFTQEEIKYIETLISLELEEQEKLKEKNPDLNYNEQISELEIIYCKIQKLLGNKFIEV
jgi:hypothetical protein